MEDELAARRELVGNQPAGDDLIQLARSLITGHPDLAATVNEHLATKPTRKQMRAFLAELKIAADERHPRAYGTATNGAAVASILTKSQSASDIGYRELLERLRHWLDTGDETYL